MRVAIPVWNQHVSPVFDCAEQVLIVRVQSARARERELIHLTETQPARRVEQLQQLGVAVLICGALTRPLEELMIAAGIRVVARRCGGVDEVLHAFLHGRLNNHQFCLPGCCRGHARRRWRPARKKKPKNA